MKRPERVLLDTSVIIDLADVELGVHESAEPAVSAVSIAELAFGLDIDDPIERRARAERYRAVREQFACWPSTARPPRFTAPWPP